MDDRLRNAVLRDSQGNAIDPAELESDEPPELKEAAEERERESRWKQLTRIRLWRSGGWWWRR